MVLKAKELGGIVLREMRLAKNSIMGPALQESRPEMARRPEFRDISRASYSSPNLQGSQDEGT